MIELKKIDSAWAYSEETLGKSENIEEILEILLKNCREYYGVVGFDFPSFEIFFDGKKLNMDCGSYFRMYDNDKEVSSCVKSWYEGVKQSSMVEKAESIEVVDKAVENLSICETKEGFPNETCFTFHASVDSVNVLIERLRKSMLTERFKESENIK